MDTKVMVDNKEAETPQPAASSTQPDEECEQEKVPLKADDGAAPPPPTLTPNTVIVATAPTYQKDDSWEAHGAVEYIERRCIEDEEAPTPSSYPCMSLFTICCCCCAFGAIGLLFSVLVKVSLAREKREDAERYSACAFKWNFAGIIVGIIFLAIGAILYFYPVDL